MKPRRVLIDTDILSYQLAHHPKVGKKVERYVKRHREVSISVITAFEYMRGLHELKNYNPKKAQEKIEAYRAFLKRAEVLPITEQVAEKAAELFEDLRQRGEPVGVPDVLIAATALVNGYGIATNNVKHFERIISLRVENWAA